MKDAAQRKRDERERMRAEGYVLRQVWVRPEDWAALKKYLRRMRTKDPRPNRLTQ